MAETKDTKKTTPQNKEVKKDEKAQKKSVTPQKKQSITPQKKSTSKADAKEKEKQEKIEKKIEETQNEKKSTEDSEKKTEAKNSKKSEKKEEKPVETEKEDKLAKNKNMEEEQEENQDQEDQENKEENQEGEEKKKPGRRGRKPGQSIKKQKDESQQQDSDSEEKIRLTRSQKRTKLDNRELYKNELKNREWPKNEELEKYVKEQMEKLKQEKLSEEMLKTIYSTIDLTSLNSTDAPEYIEDWLEKNVIQIEKEHNLKPAAICVYPLYGKISKRIIKPLKSVKTAVVSTCFPTGQTFLEIKLQETRIAVREGADEVDMVVSRGFWNEGSELEVLEEIYETKKAALNQHLKVILENCELKGGYEAIYKLSYLSLCAGGDFIKTSTGKGKWGAKPEEFAVMCKALKDFYELKHHGGESRGIKAAGGIQDSKTAHQFIQLFENITGKKVTPENFRIGASSLAKNIIKDLADLK
ncbi:hypothetical protein PPERSA_03336 [Pseudocohnilembus persalinus]|uniref:deoxyribose-phosphate aldolase n=1 Tax=Pseudocohnilembus persalinus TaxID=266149 RepID=A0A0V0R1B8_PSEPJ|nr:hypothetical protein PPERSA_03336 [Pseudocohnilembus persalinus]|eukprot:KRX08342.1 hypothetical protein PPERSA_03336 [Pseudocohnilembus persalinus]